MDQTPASYHTGLIWAPVVIVALNTVGSVLITWIKAIYGIPDYRTNGGSDDASKSGRRETPVATRGATSPGAPDLTGPAL